MTERTTSEQLVTGKIHRKAQTVKKFCGESFLLIIASASALAILFILLTIFREALPFFANIGASELFGSSDWYPTRGEPSFGALGIFMGSFLITLGSCIIAVPLGIAAAICLSDVIPFATRQFVKPVLELLAAIPSVVFGFFALVVFAPLLQNRGGFILAIAWWVIAIPVALILVIVLADLLTTALPDKPRKVAAPLLGIALGALALFGIHYAGSGILNLQISNGVNALNASIILALMALPTIVSVSEDALSAVGRSLREGSYALGSTRAETIFKVILPAAKGGIIAAVILGVMRAIGETMVVLMAAGNSIEIPEPWYNFLEGVRTLTATVALEMGETVHGGTHYHALFALAFCLLVFTFLLNLVSEWVSRRSKF